MQAGRGARSATMSTSSETAPGPGEAPPCPITGEPAARLIQKIPARFLRLIWRFVGWTDVSKLFAGVNEIELWESRCGLAFFSPPIEGDEDFYKTFYGRFKAHKVLATVAGERDEFIQDTLNIPFSVSSLL